MGLMLLKILLRFPITPMVPFILEQFFTHFVNWPWPMPIQFAPLGADKTEASEKKLGWQADREKGQKQKMLQSKVRHVEGWHLLPTLTMPIISPCKPERNVAYSVNHSTQQIIQRQLKSGE
jgi:poly(A) polymerase Pap1